MSGSSPGIGPLPFKANDKLKRTVLKDWGLLRNVICQLPYLFSVLEVWLVHSARLLLHVALLGGLFFHATGLTGGPGSQAPLRPGATMLLGAMAFDLLPGLASSLLGWCWLLGLPTADEDVRASLRRWAVLYPVSISALHAAAVVRWRRRPSEYMVPPLFPFLVYFVVPWLNLSVWLVELREGDHALAGGVVRDVALVLMLLLGRTVVFGEKGFTRAPRRPSLFDVIVDAVSLAGMAATLALCLRSAALERRKNWKYVLCAANLVWPWFKLARIVGFFKADFFGPEEAAETTSMPSGSPASMPSGSAASLTTASPDRSRRSRPRGARVRQALPKDEAD